MTTSQTGAPSRRLNFAPPGSSAPNNGLRPMMSIMSGPGFAGAAPAGFAVAAAFEALAIVTPGDVDTRESRDQPMFSHKLTLTAGRPPPAGRRAAVDARRPAPSAC